MAETPLGYYKWYPRDFYTSIVVRSMSFTARAIYRELLDVQWENGCLTDVQRLLNVMGVSAEQWSEFAPFLEELFPNGVNKRLHELREEAIELQERKAAAGRASAERRLKNNTCSTPVQQVFNQTETETETETNVIDINNGAEAESKFVPPSVAEIEEYARINGKPNFAFEFWTFYESKGWFVGKNKMDKWRVAYGGWCHRETKKGRKGKPTNTLASEGSRYQPGVAS